ncbi:MAG: acyl carrier protein [Clostridiales bacterium]|jgi:acyl carrier protein|nr:acyl carrier protein [Clostridiales bacterium]HAW15723.1 acyl carrier protein [Clostridiales bacterium]
MEELLEILKDIHSDVDYDSCETLIDDGIFDSFDIVTIVAEVGDRFDILIPPQEIIPENFNSARSLFALIERLQED